MVRRQRASGRRSRLRSGAVLTSEGRNLCDLARDPIRIYRLHVVRSIDNDQLTLREAAKEALQRFTDLGFDP